MSLIFQDGNYYVAGIAVSGPEGTWNLGSASGLQASDFDLLSFATGATDPTQHPDFDGGAMLFGLEAAVSADAQSFSTNYDFRYDNLVLTLNAVPEPSTLTMLGIAAVGLALFTRRRQASATDQTRR